MKSRSTWLCVKFDFIKSSNEICLSEFNEPNVHLNMLISQLTFKKSNRPMIRSNDNFDMVE
ncbi:hypothetical protein HanIR_Chr08g0369141 [Helianthus annuus]|nr:hypothetical protein HanIR_Chr08g0369141 [Helianthus annuus]